MPEQSKRLIDVHHPDYRAWERRWKKFRLGAQALEMALRVAA